MFELWAEFVIRSGVCSPIFTAIMLIYVMTGMSYKTTIRSDAAWTPKGNESIAAAKASYEFFPQGFAVHKVEMNFVAKPQAPSNDANLLTLEAFREMIEFDDRMKSEIYLEQNGIKYFYEDLCETFSPQ